MSLSSGSLIVNLIFALLSLTTAFRLPSFIPSVSYSRTSSFLIPLRSTNDPTNPSLDEDGETHELQRKVAVNAQPTHTHTHRNPIPPILGYTLYTDPATNTTARVFEQLVDYPSVFTIKVVGENTPTFTPDMIDLVNTHADVKTKSTKINGKVRFRLSESCQSNKHSICPNLRTSKATIQGLAMVLSFVALLLVGLALRSWFDSFFTPHP